jgi:hypothetical protein
MGTEEMKRLITVFFVLLAGLSLVNAAGAANATGGFIFINSGSPAAAARVGFFDIWGREFFLSGQLAIDPSMNDFDFAAPGKPFHFSFTQTTPSCGPTSSPLQVSLTVQSVPWGGVGSCATLTATGQTDGPVTGSGAFSGAFSMDSSFVGGNFPYAV